MIIIKPFDLVVAIKIGINERALRASPSRTVGEPLPANSMSDLSATLNRGKADVSRSIQRLLSSGLIAEREPTSNDPAAHNRKYYSVQRQGLSDFILHGVRFAFVPNKIGYGRGIPTGWNCPFVTSAINPPDIPMVWPTPGGETSGELLEPLYPGAPWAASRDKELYSILSLIEIIRTGKPRELKYARDLLHTKIMELHI